MSTFIYFAIHVAGLFIVLPIVSFSPLVGRSATLLDPILSIASDILMTTLHVPSSLAYDATTLPPWIHNRRQGLFSRQLRKTDYIALAPSRAT